ncbi:MAG: HD domain-containing protein [Candidatus Moranbacteria bacterium]|nr:HD domain-containing protein [Candidatus Moranbacteria bacterium]
MDDIEKILVMYRLKQVDRAIDVLDRKESSAEHSWSCMILADYFLTTLNPELNRTRIMDLLLYHDLVEVESGDTFIYDQEGQRTKKQREAEGFEMLRKNIPRAIAGKYADLHDEYEKRESPEARFAHAIDKLDPIIHSLHNTRSWERWNLSEENIRQSKEKYLMFSDDFTRIFEELIDYLKTNGLIRS